MRVKGFRKDDDTVGAFRFVNKKQSYATGQGKGGNEGVISVRFFGEKHKQVLFANQSTITYTGPADGVWFSPSGIDPNSSAGNPNQNQYWTSCGDTVGGQARGVVCDSNVAYQSGMKEIKSNSNPFTTGTTWGTKKFDKVYKREFERGNLLGEINFYYTTKDGLKSLGVPVVEEKYVSYPKGFDDYATPPKGWA
jgi:hypothetical protein